MKKSNSPDQSTTRPARTGGGGSQARGLRKSLKTLPLATARKARLDGSVKAPTFHDHEARPVRLVYVNPAAREVELAGSFNDWQPQKLPAPRQPGEPWAAELLLKPGEYQYRFVVDGEWGADPGNPNSVPNPFGGVNSTLTVPATGTVDDRLV